MKKLLLIISLLFSTLAFADSPLCPPGTSAVPNDATTGTTLYKLAKMTSAGNAIIMTTADTTGYVGVVVANAGTTGFACLATSGAWPLTMDGSTTVQHYIQISSTVTGDGKDTGSTTAPTTGGATNTLGQNYLWSLSGQIQWNASTPGTFSIQALDNNSPSSTLTIVAGASCSITL